MDRKTTKPARTPGRARPTRRRTHARPKPAPIPHHGTVDATPQALPPIEDADPKTELGGGGASGHGPLDGDGGGDGKRPDRGGDDSKPLLIALGLIALGTVVMSARLLGTASQRRGATAPWSLRPRRS